jgi:hypothetical protein
MLAARSNDGLLAGRVTRRAKERNWGKLRSMLGYPISWPPAQLKKATMDELIIRAALSNYRQLHHHDMRMQCSSTAEGSTARAPALLVDDL